MKMGTKFPKIDKNGDTDPQNRQKWGHRSPKWAKMGTTVATIVATVATIVAKSPQNGVKWG